MNWSDKAELIAEDVMKRCKPQGELFILTRDALNKMLSDAAIMGMEHELEAWLNRKKR